MDCVELCPLPRPHTSTTIAPLGPGLDHLEDALVDEDPVGLGQEVDVVGAQEGKAQDRHLAGVAVERDAHRGACPSDGEPRASEGDRGQENDRKLEATANMWETVVPTLCELRAWIFHGIFRMIVFFPTTLPTQKARVGCQTLRLFLVATEVGSDWAPLIVSDVGHCDALVWCLQVEGEHCVVRYHGSSSQHPEADPAPADKKILKKRLLARKRRRTRGGTIPLPSPRCGRVNSGRWRGAWTRKTLLSSFNQLLGWNKLLPINLP